ncbi:MAG: vWA domain-containing protein [Myxococcota bacterium]|nr:vWA domain-containing protein [Myxococcota bacterium]
MTRLLVIIALLFPVTGSASAETGDLPHRDTLVKMPRQALSKGEQKALKKKLEGSWRRVGYHAWDGEEYMEIPSGRDGVNETVETWMLRPNGRFKHVMGDNLWFTGRWNVEESFGLPATEARRPRYLVLAVDNSGTMKGEPMKGARRAALALVNRLQSTDHVALVTFGAKVDAVDFKAPRTRLKKRIGALGGSERLTKLHDGVLRALALLKKAPKGADKSLVVISDGKDEGSKADLLACLDAVESAGVQVHGIAFSRVEGRFAGSLKAMSRAAPGSYSEAREPEALFQASERAFQAAVPGSGTGAFFVLHTTGVKTSMASKRDHDWFIGTFMDEGQGSRELLLFYVGERFDLTGRHAMKQATRFETAPYGAR